MSLVQDFKYNGRYLSEFDSILCSFNGGGGFDTVAGTTISLNTFLATSTQRYRRYSSVYNEVLSLTVQCCKSQCGVVTDRVYTQEEIRSLMRWLNSDTVKELILLSDEYHDIYFMATANIQKIRHGTDCVGFEITFTMDSNFGYNDYTTSLNFNEKDGNHTLPLDIDSDRESFVYPKMNIVMLEDGDLEIYSSTEPDRILRLVGCKKDDQLWIDCENRVIQSSNESHDLPGSFNHIFPRVDFTYDNEDYGLTFNLNLHVDVTITQVRKIGVI